MATVKLNLNAGRPNQSKAQVTSPSGNDQPIAPNNSDSGDKTTAEKARESVEPARNFTAWQRFLPTGPLALLPLWGGYGSIVWSLPPAEAARLKALSKDEFISELNDKLIQAPVSHG